MRRNWDDSDYEYENQTEKNELDELDTFFEWGWISRVLYTVKSGKEATVYCCQGGPRSEVELLAAKVYRSRNNRNFKNDTVYQEGRVILNERTRRAVQKKTAFGREAQAGMWLNYEWETLQALRAVGADVPRLYARAESAILMDYLGDHRQAAPLLNSVTLEPAETRPLFDQMMRNVELWLKHNYVHGDLSPFNILYWEGQLTVIDFPQAVDPRFNPHARDLLARDVDNLCRYWSRQGVQADSERLVSNLWRRFVNSQL